MEGICQHPHVRCARLSRDDVWASASPPSRGVPLSHLLNPVQNAHASGDHGPVDSLRGRPRLKKKNNSEKDHNNGQDSLTAMVRATDRSGGNGCLHPDPEKRGRSEGRDTTKCGGWSVGDQNGRSIGGGKRAR